MKVGSLVKVSPKVWAAARVGHTPMLGDTFTLYAQQPLLTRESRGLVTALHKDGWADVMWLDARQTNHVRVEHLEEITQ